MLCYVMLSFIVLEYVAPEVVFNLGHDFHVDVWALGILIFEMLMAATPFESSSPSGTFRKLAAVQVLPIGIMLLLLLLFFVFYIFIHS